MSNIELTDREFVYRDNLNRATNACNYVEDHLRNAWDAGEDIDRVHLALILASLVRLRTDIAVARREMQRDS